MMRKRNIRKYLCDVLLYMLIAIGVCSCSKEDLPGGTEGVEKDIKYLSISLHTTDNEVEAENNLRSTGTPNYDTESKIYSLEVLVFKTDDGTLDGYKSVSRITEGNRYKAITEINDVPVTAGKRDVYVVANVPDNFFAAKAVSGYTLSEFKEETVLLSNQLIYDFENSSTDEADTPIGGKKPSGKATQLIMCGYKQNVIFSNSHDKQYLGYDTNGGRPEGVLEQDGFAADGIAKFEVERLAARVAFKKITFSLSGSLLLEGSDLPPIANTDYEYSLDSVFLLNVKTASCLVSNNVAPVSANFGHGNEEGYTFFRTPLSLATGSVLDKSFEEGINSVTYDATLEGEIPSTGANHSPLWFYVFENFGNATSPTYFVLGVRFDFIDHDRNLKTVKCYYPVKVNGSGGGQGDKYHTLIKRNYQYSITAVIKGLGTFYDRSLIQELKSTSVAEAPTSVIEVEQTVGRNLFPWTGNVYK